MHGITSTIIYGIEMTTRDEARAALELQRQEKQAEIDALMARLEEEQEDLINLDTVVEGLNSQSPDVHVNVSAPIVNVDSPVINVEVPEQNTPIVNVEVPEQPAPVINVEPQIEFTATGIAEAIATSNAMLLQRLEEVRQDLRAVARAANVNVPGLLNGNTSSN